jgi:hypothetical protein
VPQGGADLGKQAVALEVPEALVHLLEAVEVEQDDGELPRVAEVTGDFFVEALLQRPVVADAGQLVAAGERPERLVAGAQAEEQDDDTGRDRGQAGGLDQGEYQRL